VSFARRARAASARWAALLAVALLWSQGVGLLHGVVHAPHVAPALAAQPMAAGDVPVVMPSEVRAGIERLFGAHGEHTPACHLYDQLTHAQALPSAIPVLVAVVRGEASPPIGAEQAHAVAPAPFLARAPPAHA
jgi:hypothetical protein